MTRPGTLAWTQLFDAQGHDDIPIRIAVDNAHDVFVAADAWFGFTNYFDFATIRYAQPGSRPVDAQPQR